MRPTLPGSPGHGTRAGRAWPVSHQLPGPVIPSGSVAVGTPILMDQYIDMVTANIRALRHLQASKKGYPAKSPVNRHGHALSGLPTQGGTFPVPKRLGDLTAARSTTSLDGTVCAPRLARGLRAAGRACGGQTREHA